MRKNSYSNEELLVILKNYIATNGIPTSKTFKAANGLPAAEVYRLRFGSWYNAIRLSGITIPEEKQKYYQNDRKSDKQILDDLRETTLLHLKNNKYLLTLKDIEKYPSMQCGSVYIKRFGGIKKAYELIGYDYKEFNNIQLEKDMLLKLKELSEILGHSPSTYDLNEYSQKYSEFYSASTYDRHFGNISNALLKVGLNITSSSKTRRMSKDQMILKLREIYKETGRYPDQLVLNSNPDYPNYGTYVSRFGSWENAFKMAFNKKIVHLSQRYQTHKGNICRSKLEYIFACMLEKKNIDYEIDNIYYKDYIPNLNRKYRFDFMITLDSKKYFIEIFGLDNYKSYDKVKQHKIKLCNDNNLNLIYFNQHEINNKTQNDLFELLMKKILESSNGNAIVNKRHISL